MPKKIDLSNPKDIEHLIGILNDAKGSIKNNEMAEALKKSHDVSCPHCSSLISVKSRFNVCPSCQNGINVTLKN